jgi:hypothetical protein
MSGSSCANIIVRVPRVWFYHSGSFDSLHWLKASVRSTPCKLYVLHLFAFWFPYADHVSHRSYIFDVEFQIFNFACLVGFEITLQRYTGEMIMSTTIDYDAKTIDTLIREYEDVAPVRFRLRPDYEDRYAFLASPLL